MANPYLPVWEYIPDGEPRVFGDRIYVYGSHDKAGSTRFCDYVLKCWSASTDDLEHWTCHGDIFHTKDDRDHLADADWAGEENELYAPDVVEKDGKYYLYAYIAGAKGCVAVSEKPEGPFHLVSQYRYDMPEEVCVDGQFIDPGVLVDDDGRVYIYCGFQRSFAAEVNPQNMYEILPDTYVQDVIPIEPDVEHGFADEKSLFFEACSPRKINGKYYLIYSPKQGSRLAYAVSDKPLGPFCYKGYIIDNEIDYPGGNDHGSVVKIHDQWYIFYHKMTNGTIFSRRGCVEPITLDDEGNFSTVEMTSLGFSKALYPFEITQAEYACVLKNGPFITEKNVLERVVTHILDGSVIGYKYFDFGEDLASKTMEFAIKTDGRGCDSEIHIHLDSEDGKEIGTCLIGKEDGVYTTVVERPTGRHAIYFAVQTSYPKDGWEATFFAGRELFAMHSFTFML